MRLLSWENVHTWRCRQHQLHERAVKEHLLEVVSRIGGVHAQLMSAAEMALAARLDNLSPDDIQEALWQERSLVKTWAMRGTLHLITASDFPLYVGALSTLRHFRRASWLKYHQVTLEEVEAIIEGVKETLNDTPITREQLAEALAERTRKPHLRDLLESGWGALLKPAAFQGYLCYGPSEGQNITFVAPYKWIGEWEPVEPEAAKEEITRRYLTAYGPATVADFSRWLGLPDSKVKQTPRALGDEGELVDVEGWEAWALHSTVNEIQRLKPVHSVRLLPYFDPYVVAMYRHSDLLLPEEHKRRVYRPQGWIYPAVLVDGRMEGVWEYDQQSEQMKISVEMFKPPTERVKEKIAVEAIRLGGFLGKEVKLDYARL